MDNEQNQNEEISIDERYYLPKVISNSLDRNTKGLGEK